MNSEYALWGIHSGSQAQADNLFLKKKYIALGWDDTGDLSVLGNDREAFKQKLIEIYPDSKPGSIAIWGGQLYRFVHEMKVGDLICYPSKVDRMVHLGQVEGEYTYDPSISSEFPHLRVVKWLKEVPRTSFTQGALYEIGSAMTLFLVKNYAEEFITALSGEISEAPAKHDETIMLVAEDIIETTRDYILKKLSQELKGHPFAEFVAHLLNTLGYKTRLSPEGPDGGIDIIAHKDELGFEPPIIKVQVKSSTDKIGDPIVSQLFGKVDNNEFGLFVTLGRYTHQAINFARNKSNLRLINGDDVVNLIQQQYDLLDSKYKGLILLKKVYVPEAIEDE